MVIEEMRRYRLRYRRLLADRRYEYKDIAV